MRFNVTIRHFFVDLYRHFRELPSHLRMNNSQLTLFVVLLIIGYLRHETEAEILLSIGLYLIPFCDEHAT